MIEETDILCKIEERPNCKRKMIQVQVSSTQSMENSNGVKIYDWTPKESDCEKQGRYNPKVKERRKKKSAH